MWTVVAEFFVLGLFTFGGGMAMIPLFLEIVTKNQWFTEAQFSDFIAISQSTPGPIAINMATFAGYEEAWVAGGVIASIVIVLPGFVLSVALSNFLSLHRESGAVKAVMEAMKAAVLALMIYAIYILFGVSVGFVPVKLLMFFFALLLTFAVKLSIGVYLAIFAALGILFA